MDTFATMICTAANVEAARAAQAGATFSTGLSATGSAPATHYVSSGYMRADDLAALAGLCDITTGHRDGWQVIADAGLQVVAGPQ